MGRQKDTERTISELQAKADELQEQLRSLNNRIYYYQGRLVPQKESEIAELNAMLAENTQKKNEANARCNELKNLPEVAKELPKYAGLLKEKNGHTEGMYLPPSVQEFFRSRQELINLNREKVRLDKLVTEKTDWINQYNQSKDEYDLSGEQVDSIEEMDGSQVKKTLEELCSQRFLLTQKLDRTNLMREQAEKVQEAFLGEEEEEELVSEIEMPEGEEAQLEAEIAFFKENAEKIEALINEMEALDQINDPPQAGFMDKLDEACQIAQKARQAEIDQNEIAEQWNIEGLSELHTDPEISAKYEDFLETRELQDTFSDGLTRMRHVVHSSFFRDSNFPLWEEADRVYDRLSNGEISLDDLKSVTVYSRKDDRDALFPLRSLVIAKYEMIHCFSENDPRRDEVKDYFDGLKLKRMAYDESLYFNQNDKLPISRIKGELDKKIETLLSDKQLADRISKRDDLLADMRLSEENSQWKKDKIKYEEAQKDKNRFFNTVKPWIKDVNNGSGYQGKVYDIADRFNDLPDEIKISFDKRWDFTDVHDILEHELQEYKYSITQHEDKLAVLRGQKQPDSQVVIEEPEEPEKEPVQEEAPGIVIPPVKDEGPEKEPVQEEAPGIVIPPVYDEGPKAEPVQQQAPPQAPVQAPPQAPVQNAQQKQVSLKVLEEDLIRAKTFYNSREYNNIITAVQDLRNEKGASRDEALATVGVAIRKYLKHKSRDGVKPNVMKKLAAVERLSQYIDRNFSQYRTWDNTKDKVVDGEKYSDIVLTTEDRFAHLDKVSKDLYTEVTNPQFNRVQFKAGLRNLNDNQKNMVTTIAGYANDCMNKIVMGAAEIGGREGRIRELADMRNNFRNPDFAVESIRAKDGPQLDEEAMIPQM